MARARLAEERAKAALAAAEEERRRTRRERDESVKAARDEAERLLDEVRGQVRQLRKKLERETVTQRSLDEDLDRAREAVEKLPRTEPRVERPPEAAPVQWRVGMRARSVSGGWQGRVASIDKDGLRATLEAGGLRVAVPVDDLEPAVGGEDEGVSASAAGGGRKGPPPAFSDAGASRLQLERARTVASSLDLRGARVEEALGVLDRYLDDASLASLDQATVIHGLGTGALRDAVREHLAGHPLVRSWRPGGHGEGGDGATIVTL
jgi:DNA mismatch repair protein MutS2